jgi:hypothetical protein
LGERQTEGEQTRNEESIPGKTGEAHNHSSMFPVYTKLHEMTAA